MNNPLVTVKEIIDILKSFPDDLPVLVSGYESGYERFHHPEVRKLVHKPENMYYDGEYQLPETDESPALAALVIERVHRDD